MKVKDAIEILKKMDPDMPFVFSIIEETNSSEEKGKCLALNIDDIHEVEFEDGEVVVTAVTDDEIGDDIDEPLTSFICLN
jgi:ArsR family metal-binding transcriptional regulator